MFWEQVPYDVGHKLVEYAHTVTKMLYTTYRHTYICVDWRVLLHKTFVCIDLSHFINGHFKISNAIQYIFTVQFF